MEKRLNFSVGPVMMPDDILQIGKEQIPYFRTETFSNIMKENEKILKMWYLYCPHCKKKINLDRFIFYNCHEENGEYIKGRYNRRNKK